MSDTAAAKNAAPTPFGAIAPTLRQLARAGSQALLEGLEETARAEVDNLRVQGMSQVQGIQEGKKAREVEVGARLNAEMERLKANAAEELDKLDKSSTAEGRQAVAATQSAIDALAKRVAAYRDALSAHFSKIDSISDPAEILRLIDARPTPPDLSTTPAPEPERQTPAADGKTPPSDREMPEGGGVDFADNPLIAQLQGMRLEVPEPRKGKAKAAAEVGPAAPEATPPASAAIAVPAPAPVSQPFADIRPSPASPAAASPLQRLREAAAEAEPAASGTETTAQAGAPAPEPETAPRQEPPMAAPARPHGHTRRARQPIRGIRARSSEAGAHSPPAVRGAGGGRHARSARVRRGGAQEVRLRRADAPAGRHARASARPGA